MEGGSETKSLSDDTKRSRPIQEQIVRTPLHLKKPRNKKNNLCECSSMGDELKTLVVVGVGGYEIQLQSAKIIHLNHFLFHV